MVRKQEGDLWRTYQVVMNTDLGRQDAASIT